MIRKTNLEERGEEKLRFKFNSACNNWNMSDGYMYNEILKMIPSLQRICTLIGKKPQVLELLSRSLLYVFRWWQLFPYIHIEMRQAALQLSIYCDFTVMLFSKESWFSFFQQCVKLFTSEYNQNSPTQGCVKVNSQRAFIHSYMICKKRKGISRKERIHI